MGNLGSGIYFSDAFRSVVRLGYFPTTNTRLIKTLCLRSTSLKYSQPSVTDGSRMLLVCDVVLGQCKDVYQRDLTLTEAPQGFHSVHGVCDTPAAPSEFEVGALARSCSGLQPCVVVTRYFCCRMMSTWCTVQTR